MDNPCSNVVKLLEINLNSESYFITHATIHPSPTTVGRDRQRLLRLNGVARGDRVCVMGQLTRAGSSDSFFVLCFVDRLLPAEKLGNAFVLPAIASVATSLPSFTTAVYASAKAPPDFLDFSSIFLLSVLLEVRGLLRASQVLLGVLLCDLVEEMFRADRVVGFFGATVSIYVAAAPLDTHYALYPTRDRVTSFRAQVSHL
jgi:hypothetical protein